MGHYDKTFPEVLKTAWDDLFKKHPKLVLVLCGSVSMWIKENIIDNGAFAGRRSSRPCRGGAGLLQRRD